VPHVLALMALGAVQLGLMYVFLYQSFLLLSVPEVVLFTIFTPVYVAVIDDALAGRFSPAHLASAILAVIGAGVIRYQQPESEFWLGFFVVQGANVCFAAGQVGYRYLSPNLPRGLAPHSAFGWFYIGALVLSSTAFVLFGDTGRLPTTGVQWGVLLWLGLVASGAGYFLWNLGGTRVDAGTLAVMNNVLVPAGLVVNVVIWNRDADLVRLTLGGAILLIALAVGLWFSGKAGRNAQRA